MKISSSRKKKTVVFDFNGTHSFLLVSGFLPVLFSFLALRKSAIIFLLKRMTIHTHRHIHRKLDFRFYCRDALLFDQFHHFRYSTQPTQDWHGQAIGIHSALGETLSMCKCTAHTHLIIYAHLYEAKNSRQQQLGIL